MADHVVQSGRFKGMRVLDITAFSGDWKCGWIDMDATKLGETVTLLKTAEVQCMTLELPKPKRKKAKT